MNWDFLQSNHISFTWEFLVAIVSIVIIDIILAGDNAVVIAMAVKSLPANKRFQGIIFGAGAAVLLRVVLTFFAAQLLLIQFVKFVGGALIIWIAVKLLIEGDTSDEGHKECTSIWHAVWIIVIADISMSVDNVLAVAGASRGNPFLLIFGLGLSIPLVVFTSNLLSKLMDRYPLILYIGAAILGRVGGEMMMTDPFVQSTFHPSNILRYCVEVSLTIGVIVVAKIWLKMTRDDAGSEPIVVSPEPPVDN
jgi:YjbE family integral membrane protein